MSRRQRFVFIKTSSRFYKRTKRLLRAQLNIDYCLNPVETNNNQTIDVKINKKPYKKFILKKKILYYILVNVKLKKK